MVPSFNSCLLEFRINVSGLKLIIARLKKKVDKCKQGKRVQVAGLSKFEATSEASDTESPLLGKSLEKSVQASTKRKMKKSLMSALSKSRRSLLPWGLPKKKRRVRKTPQHAQEVSLAGEEESTAYVPHSDPLIARSPSLGETERENT